MINKTETNRHRLPLFILIFSISFAIFVLFPPLLGYTFGPYPLMKIADVFDLFTPLILVPLYWILFHLNSKETTNLKLTVIFLGLASIWILGQSMHLTANSIGHLTESMTGTSIYTLTSFYDERLGHYVWHFGVIGLSALLIFHQWKNPLTEKINPGKIIPAGIIYGFTFFAMLIEGVTWPMGLPFSIIATIIILFRIGGKIKYQPLNLFFLTGYLVTLVLFTAWGIWQQGLPEFSKVGII